jgi:endoglucanase
VKPRLPWMLRRTRVLVPVIALVAALLAGGSWALGNQPTSIVDASASIGCSVQYTVNNQWYNGFTMALRITNLGRTLTKWRLHYRTAGGQHLTAGWDGVWGQSGRVVTVSSVSWNHRLVAGRTTQIGANFSFYRDTAAPTVFWLNGVRCSPPAGVVAPVVPASPSASASATPAPAPSRPAPTPSVTPTPAPTVSAPSQAPVAPAGPAPQLQVAGNKLVNAAGQQVVLHGVDRPGFEYECLGNGFSDGPVDQASVTAMKSVGITAVRIPLNEACWNAESYIKPQFAGTAYQSAVKSYVGLLNANGIVAILDLHWTDGSYSGPGANCTSAEAVCQKPMPDSAQAVPFWSSVARTFTGNDAVIFDLFNEPFPGQGQSAAAGWQCWLDGGSCAGIGYPVAGMQTLVDAVRAAGAHNVIMLGGLTWANNLDGWLEHEPSDPDHDLAASFHSYNFNGCNNAACWDSQVAPVIARVPVIAGEIGETDCTDNYIDGLMNWLDSQQTSYLAWSWNTTESCSGGPGLITSYDGAPNSYGAGLEAHLKMLAG